MKTVKFYALLFLKDIISIAVIILIYSELDVLVVKYPTKFYWLNISASPIVGTLFLVLACLIPVYITSLIVFRRRSFLGYLDYLVSVAKTVLVEVILVVIPVWIFALWLFNSGGEGGMIGFIIFWVTLMIFAVILFSLLITSGIVFKTYNRK